MERGHTFKMEVLAHGFAVGAMLLLAGCTFRPSIQSTQSIRVQDLEVVAVSFLAVDAAKLRNRVEEFSVVLFECEGRRDEFRTKAFIEVSRSGESILVTGRFPALVFERYAKPCVFLQGGSTLMGKIESTSSPVVASRSRPN
jgi:hypothetical protein